MEYWALAVSLRLDAARRAAQIGKLRHDFRVGERGIDLPVELVDDFVKCSLVHAAPASSRESCPGAAVPCRPPWAKSTSTHPARSKKCAAKPPRGANRLFPINQLINRRWARLAGRL